MQLGLVMRAHAAPYDDGRLRPGLPGAGGPAGGKRATWLDAGPPRGKRVTWLDASPARGKRVTWLDASPLGCTPGERGTRRSEA
jgi:hypothetical protein